MFTIHINTKKTEWISGRAYYSDVRLEYENMEFQVNGENIRFMKDGTEFTNEIQVGGETYGTECTIEFHQNDMIITTHTCTTRYKNCNAKQSLYDCLAKWENMVSKLNTEDSSDEEL